MSLPFISLVGGRFVINPAAKSHLLSLPSDKPVGVLSIVGKYRTGKSFFLNNVILDHESVFPVGPTINPCTKGIWVGKQLLAPTSNNDMRIIVLDVEGFGIIDEQETSDARIFLFPLLLSSYLLYNSIGNITEEAVRTLGIIVELAREVQLKSHRKEACSYFPAFHWVLRDFTLQLEDSAGKQISARQYLERALETQKGISESIEQKNRIRRNFKDFFTERHCTTLLRPTHSDQDTDTAREFRPEFLQEARITREHILRSIRPKCMNGANLTIGAFVDLSETLVDMLNNGTVPNLETAWSAIYTGRQRSIILELVNQTNRLFEEGILFSNVDQQRIGDEVDRHFKTEFAKISMCPDHPTEEVQRLIQEAITNTTKEFIFKLQSSRSSEAEQQLGEIYTEFETNSTQFNSVEQIKQQLSQIKLTHLEIFSRLPLARQYEIESDVKLRCVEALCVRIEIELAVLDSQNHSLRTELADKAMGLSMKDQRIKLLEQELESRIHSAKNWERQTEELRQALAQKKQIHEHLELKIRSNEQIIISLENSLKNSGDSLYKQAINRMGELEDQITKLQLVLQQNCQRDCQNERLKNALENDKQLLRQEIDQLRLDLSKQAEHIGRLNGTIDALRHEGEQRERKINETQTRIYQQIEAEEANIRTLLMASETREREKDFIIEKLERILKEATSRRSEPVDHGALKKLREELERTRTQNKLLGSQLSSLSKDLDCCTLELSRLKSSNLSSQNVKSSLMNVGLTNKGFEIRSFVSPSSHKHSKSGTKTKNPFRKIEQACINTQLELQAQSVEESQRLIQTLLERQQTLRKEIDTLRQGATTRLDNSRPQWLSANENAIMLAVPAYFVKDLGNDRTTTDYQIVVRLEQGQSWTVRRKFKMVCDLRKSLMESYSGIQSPNLHRSTHLEEKRKDIQEFLKACLKIDAYRNSLQLKRFLCDANYQVEGVSQRPSSPNSRITENTYKLPKKQLGSSSKCIPTADNQNANSQQKQPLQNRALNNRS